MLTPLLAVSEENYVPLTDQEIEQYLGSITYEQLIEEIRLLDKIEHSEPEVNFPDRIVFIEGENLHITYSVPYIDMTVADHLHYQIPVENKIFQDFIPPPESRTTDSFISSGVGTVIGIALYALLPIESEFIKGVAGLAGGGASGGITFLILGWF